MRIGSVCSGFGGLDMGLMDALGGTVAWHVENDPAVNRILEHHWPEVPNLGDIKAVNWRRAEPIDWLTAGYPCQPFSLAGQRKGADDARHLWPHVAEAIRLLRPRMVLLENVRSHLTLGFDAVLGTLADLGYDAQWACVRASDAGAPHRRERLFVVAHPNGQRGNGCRPCSAGWPQPAHRGDAAADPDGTGPQGHVTALAPGGRTQPGHRHVAVAHPGGQRVEGRVPTTGANAQRQAASALGRPGVRPGNTRVDWGAYTPAIRRWERILQRDAPDPTEPGQREGARRRLAAPFVEWLMGLPEGHVIEVAGLSRTQQLKALGNGVIPQQAQLALSYLTASTDMEAAA